MADTARVRPIEYVSPRPLILTLCFLWGIGVGFALNFFRAPDQPVVTAQKNEKENTDQRTVPNELERRRQDIPSLAEVDLVPTPVPTIRQTLEDIVVEPPPATLTTEGGLTGATAQPLRSQPRPAAPPPVSRPWEPPPIPDLSP